jgi:Ca2+-binding EF-hand superfamily protein
MFEDSREAGERFLSYLPFYYSGTGASEFSEDDISNSIFSQEAASPVEGLTMRFVAAVEKTRKPLKMIFERVDRNRNGILEPKDFTEMIKSAVNLWLAPDEMETMVNLADPKATGRISYQQLVERIDLRKKSINSYL